jgi:hypothetical protein
MVRSHNPFWQDTIADAGASSGSNRSTAATVCCALTASSTMSSGPSSSSGERASTGTVNVSAKPRIVSPRARIAATWSGSASTSRTGAPSRAR